MISSKILRLAAVFTAIVLAPLSLHAQARDFHTQRVVLDDGNGNTTTIQTTGAANGTFTVPSNTPNSGDVITSTTSGGTTWQAPGGLPSGTVIMYTSSTAPSGYTLLSGPTILSGANSWTSEAAVPTYRNVPMTGAINGKIYVVGGYASSLAALSSMDVYDAASNTWSTDVTTGTFTGRAEGSAAVVGGKLYVMGGNKNPGYSTDNQVYDPVAKSWTTKAAIPSTGRYGPIALASGNYIYLIGGGNGQNLLNNDVYDVSTDTWNTTKTGVALTSVMSGAVGAALNGKFYLLANNVSPDFRSYDATANTWSTLGVTGLTSRQSATLAAANGNIYAIGGVISSGPPNPPQYLNTTELFNPSTGTWSAGISNGLTPQYGAVSAVVSSTIYMLCGKNGGASNATLNESIISGTSIYYYVKN